MYRDRLTQKGLHLLNDNSVNYVGAATRVKRNDHLNGAARVGGDSLGL